MHIHPSLLKMSRKVDCSSGCSWGSQALIYGNFTIYDSSLNIYPNVTVSAWGQEAFASQIDLCDGSGSSTNSSNAYWYKTDCPSEGTYKFSSYATLPNPSQWRFSASMFVTVSSIFDFDDEVVVCTFNVFSTTYCNGDGYGNSNNSYNAYFITSGAVVSFGAVAHGIRRRRRRIATAHDCNDIHKAVMSRVLSHPFERIGKEESTRSLPHSQENV